MEEEQGTSNSRDCDIVAKACIVEGKDVPFGRGGNLNQLRNKNSLWMKLLDEHWKSYSDEIDTKKVLYVQEHIVAPIHEKGGRFLVMNDLKGTEYRVVKEDEALKTIQQALRDKKKPNKRDKQMYTKAGEISFVFFFELLSTV